MFVKSSGSVTIQRKSGWPSTTNLCPHLKSRMGSPLRVPTLTRQQRWQWNLGQKVSVASLLHTCPNHNTAEKQRPLAEQGEIPLVVDTSGQALRRVRHCDKYHADMTAPTK